MTVANTNTKTIFVGNGSTKTWPVSFAVSGISDEEVLLYLTTVSTGVSEQIESNYSVDLEAGTVTYPVVGSAITSAYKIVIIRKLALTQETDFENQGSFNAQNLEERLDRFAMICQQMQEQLDRTAQSDVSGSSADSEIGELLNDVSDARDEATLAAASASADAATITALIDDAQDVADQLSASLISSVALYNESVVSANAASASAILAQGYAASALASASDAQESADNVAASLSAATAVGTPLSRTEGVDYQAATAGMVEYWASIESGDQIILYSDATTTPSTGRKQLSASTSIGTVRMCFSYLVTKGNYYRVDIVAGSSSPGGYEFVPLGI